MDTGITYCTNCGAKLDVGAAFCTACGTRCEREAEIAVGAAQTAQVVQSVQPAQAAQPAQPAQPSYQPPLQQAYQQQGQQPLPQPPVATKKPNKALPIILISVGAVVVIVAVVIALFVWPGFMRAPQSEPLDTPTTTSEPPTQNVQPANPSSPDFTGGYSELEVTDIMLGSGAAVKSGDKVGILYTGLLLDGTVIDSNTDAAFGNPETMEFTTGNGEVIAGLEAGIIGMQLGGKREIIIPPDLAYGADSTSAIPPNATLVFELELVSLNGVKAGAAQAQPGSQADAHRSVSDVAAQVENIRKLWEADRASQSAGKLTKVVLGGGATAYKSGSEVKLIEVKASGSGYKDYRRIYHFSSGQLDFAYFEAADAHRLYFKDDTLFRWRYSKNAAKSQTAINYDNDFTNSKYLAIEQFALGESADLLTKAE